MRTTVVRGRAQRGNVMLESALCLIVFLMMFFGIIEFGRCIYAYNFVQYAANQGARYAAVRGSASSQSIGTASPENDSVTNYVKTQVVGLDPNDLTVSTTFTPDNSPGSLVTVAVTYNFTFLQPFMPASTLGLSAESAMTISQ